jgi:hypothetical protein
VVVGEVTTLIVVGFALGVALSLASSACFDFSVRVEAD